jgi:hypothetical protein
MKLIKYDQSRVLDVDLDAPPAKRWADVVEQTGDQIHEIVEDVVESCEEHIEDLPEWIRPLYRLALHGTARLGGRVVGAVAKLFGQEYQTEIKGMARHAGVSYPKLLLGNLMYDFTQILDHREARQRKPVACSSFSCNLPGGTPILARNMDWALPESLGRHTVLIRFHRGRRSYLSVGVAGKVGVLSAMRPGQWAVTLNQAPVDCIKPRILQTPALQRLRQACDRFGGFRNLVRRVQEYQTMSPFFAHVVGTKPDQHVVVNGLGDEFAEREIEGKYLIQTNHFVDEELEEFNGVEEWKEDGCEWTWDSRPRYRALERRLRKLPKTVDEAVDKLKRGPVTNENTMQQMALCPGRKEMRLRVQA